MKTKMVTVFRKQTIGDRLVRLWPPEKRRKDERLRAELERLVRCPDEPCVIGGVWVPNGYGCQGGMQQQIFGCELF